jgi:hypothetical protein
MRNRLASRLRHPFSSQDSDFVEVARGVWRYEYMDEKSSGVAVGRCHVVSPLGC